MSETLTIETLKLKITSYLGDKDLSLVDRAYDFASKAHEGQMRLSGDPYITHALSTADAIADWKLDISSIVAGLLHDTVEDANVPKEQIKKEFGETIALLIDGVTKVGGIKLRGSEEEEFTENLRKMFLVMAKDLRVVLVKLADRYHNMQTLEYLPKNKQLRIAKETLEIYAPLADRLGMGEVKGQLEDLAFPYVYEEDYQWLIKYAAPHFEDAEEILEEARITLGDLFQKENIKAEINGRKKHLYSLYKKLLRPEYEKDITKVNDLVALRVIVETPEECYAALGIIHKVYRPVPSVGISDYIALPKPNGYRSIHTKVFSSKGKIVEIQIRTLEMHDQAENGIAAHWHYSSQKTKSGVSETEIDKKSFAPSEKMEWVNQLSAWQNEITDSREFLDSVKFDALAHRIFVFTPKGDVKDLPVGATAIDFAYAIHTDLGDRTIGVKVNGKAVSLDFKLKSGDICEVMLSKNPRLPNRKWLDFVVTSGARREIMRGLKAEK